MESRSRAAGKVRAVWIGALVFGCVYCLVTCLCLSAQVIEFESNGLKYQTLTKNGVTIMYANLPSHVREYSVLHGRGRVSFV